MSGEARCNRSRQPASTEARRLAFPVTSPRQVVKSSSSFGSTVSAGGLGAAQDCDAAEGLTPVVKVVVPARGKAGVGLGAESAALSAFPAALLTSNRSGRFRHTSPFERGAVSAARECRFFRTAARTKCSFVILALEFAGQPPERAANEHRLVVDPEHFHLAGFVAEVLPKVVRSRGEGESRLEAFDQRVQENSLLNSVAVRRSGYTLSCRRR